MSETVSISVAIFENSLKLLSELQALFNRSPGFHCVVASPSLKRVVEVVEKVNPDVVILDILFGFGNGLRALGEIRQARPKQNVLIYTCVDSGDEVLLAYLMGACGYVWKKDSPARLLETVRIIADGGAILSPSIAWTFRQLTFGANPPQWAVLLTTAELEVLDLLAQGLISKEIADKRGTSKKTIDKQIASVCEKAGGHSLRRALVHIGPWARVLRRFGDLMKGLKPARTLA